VGVFAQRFAADGTPTGPEFRVNVSEVGKQYYPSVAMMADGGFVIAFHTSDAEDRDFEVMARRFDAEGVGEPEFQMNTWTDSLQKMVRITATPAGFAAVWESRGQDGDGEGVYARRYDPVLGVDAEEFMVSDSGTGWQRSPSVAAAADGRIVYVWHENDPYGNFVIRSQVLSPASP
jgi:hypothetical protein